MHFDVEIVDFIDAPLSEDTGRNVGVPLQAALDALATLLGDPRATALPVTELNPLHGEADGSTPTRFDDGLARACAHWRQGHHLPGATARRTNGQRRGQDAGE